MATKIKAANRMELLRLKKKIKLAKKGHKLLKEKRDALVSEFFNLIEGLKGTRSELEAKLKDAYKSLILSQGLLGIEEVRRAADSTPYLFKLESKENTIMGVKVPVFNTEETGASTGYSHISTSTELDNAVKNFRDVLKVLIKLAEIEATVRMLAEEIKKTKRKVNALEQILIPRLEADVIYIKMRLEEMERENFSRLKVIKKRIE